MVQQHDDSGGVTAVLLIAHGSSRQAANDELVQLAKMIRARNIYDQVEIAFLELAEPTIPQGARRCVAAGATRVLLMPYFLSPGRHVTEDLQRFCVQFSSEYPNLSFGLCPPLGLHPRIIDVVLERLNEAVISNGA